MRPRGTDPTLGQAGRCRPGLALGFAVFGLIACLSYATQRVMDARNELPASAVFAQTHIPYYWRVGVSLLHGGSAGALVGVGLSTQAARRALGVLPWVVGFSVPVLVALIVVFA